MAKRVPNEDHDQPMPWTGIAAEAAQIINSVAHGEKQAAYLEIGGEYDLSANHIRRMVRALTFTTELSKKDPQLATALQASTFKAAEIIDRWHDRDPSAALAAAKRFVAGNLSLRLLSAEADGTARPTAAIDHSSLNQASFREAAWRKMLAAVGHEVLPAKHLKPLDHLSGLDRIVQERDGSKRWALVVVPPGMTQTAYYERREIDLGRALALQQFDITPVFAMPTESSPAEFRQILQAFSLPAVMVLEIGVVAAYA